MKPKVEDLAKVIEKEINYGSDGGIVCPRCGGIVTQPYYWINAQSDLSETIVEFLGIAVYDKLSNILDSIDGELTGNKKKDAMTIAKTIIDEVYL